MSFKVVHISGPPGSGKTTLARCLAGRRPNRDHHCLRFRLDSEAVIPGLRIHVPGTGLITHHECRVTPERAFERMGTELERVADGRRSGVICVETDGHPCFRNSYPYHAQVFMLKPTAAAAEIFRESEEAAQALHRAMADTCAFAAEVYGVAGLEDSTLHGELGALRPTPEPWRHVGVSTLKEFLDSPIGAAVEARTQLHPAYQSLLESDVVILNSALGIEGQSPPWRARLEALLRRAAAPPDRRPWFGECNPADGEDPLGHRALARVEELLAAGWGTG
jgi:energy-coupling factor transporter ATP-binding protein EcfA2